MTGHSCSAWADPLTWECAGWLAWGVGDWLGVLRLVLCVFGAPVRLEGQAADLAAAGGHGHLDRVGDHGRTRVVAMDQPITRREQISITVARYSHADPTATNRASVVKS